MKTAKILFLLSILFLSVNLTKADDFSEAINKAKKDLHDALNKDDEQTYLNVRGEFEKILQFNKNLWLVNYYLALTDFQLSYIKMQQQDNDGLKKYTQSSLELLNKATDEKEDFAEAWILKMGVNSNRWMYEPNKMNDIMTRISEGEDMAMKFEPDNPRIYVMKGMNIFYTPENFGGGPTVAKPLFETGWEKSITFKPKDELYPDWGGDLLAGMLALIAINDKKLNDAKIWIDKGLQKDPESLFIKNEIMSKYNEAINSNNDK